MKIENFQSQVCVCAASTNLTCAKGRAEMGLNMEKWLYVMTIKKGKLYNKVTKAVITRLVENLRNLDAAGKIELCGPFKGYPGVAGMVIFKTQSYEEAEALCKQEPLVAEGYATYILAALQVADKDNNYLL